MPLFFSRCGESRSSDWDSTWLAKTSEPGKVIVEPMKLYLFDIEGTTTDIDFVQNTLFPYSKDRINDFLTEHLYEPEVKQIVEEVKDLVQKEEHIQLSNYEVVNRLEQWIEQDRKVTPLKEIQGLIWEQGYEAGELKGHVYPDVKPFFQKIQNTGAKIALFSSGSVRAQKCVFGHHQKDDLTSLISYYFDSKIGGKRRTESYRKIAEATGESPSEITFFSDSPEELKAASEVGMKVVQLVRKGSPSQEYPAVHNFNEVSL